MACEVCKHCHEPVDFRGDYAIRDGLSYHKECHKCYVCGERDLHNAEVFKGVIFCASCSHRIFQGCYTARRSKDTRRDKDRSHRRHQAQERRRGILEMAGLVSSSSGSRSEEIQEYWQSHTLAMSTETPLRTGKEVIENKMKRSSAEIGMITEATQELLMQMDCPVVEERKTPEKAKKSSSKNINKKKVPCSDLCIAELGASTEIANMALRRKSETLVILDKSTARAKPVTSPSRSLLKESDDSRDRDESWIDSAYSSLREERKHWMDRRIRSLLKLPYVAFKRNILTRSSLISVLMSSENDECLLHKIKHLFHEDITEHQKQGLRRLYSTINRNRTPHKLGWLDLVNNRYSDSGTITLNKLQRNARCKHYKASHSYRCMRDVVMSCAGPTHSELAVFRAKLKNLLAPNFQRAPRRLAIMTSEACGNSLKSSSRKT